MDAHVLFFQGRVCVLISFCTYISRKIKYFWKRGRAWRGWGNNTR